MNGFGFAQRLTDKVPHSLAWPLSVLSTITAFAGAALFFHAAAFGRPSSAIWGGVLLVAAGVLWYIADFAAANRPV
jgi:protein-S-isoprenylcysteine O-methyltransferase Ste14